MLNFSFIGGQTVSQTVIQSSSKEAELAAAVKHVGKRNGVYQYSRRVPVEVQKDEARFEVFFGSKPLFRVSLRTKDIGEMHAAALTAHQRFEAKVAAVTQREVKPSAPAAVASEPSQTRLMPVTDKLLEGLADRYREITFDPFERLYHKADSAPNYAEEYERVLYDMETYAEESQQALLSKSSSDRDFETPAHIAERIVRKINLDAPVGSDAFGAVVGAVRVGIMRGREQIQALIEGKTIPRLPKAPKSVKPSTPTLREAVETYLSARQLKKRTETEVRSSLSLFEKVAGNKRLADISKRDFLDYVEFLAKQVIGGKSAGSVVRTPSAETVAKRVTLLRAVIAHAIDRSDFDGPNPAKDINIDAFVAKPDRSVMPQKRRFDIDELNLIFQHPWFTGCASATNTHAPGNYRLKGTEFWAPIMALLTGCRAGELGGLMLSEIALDSSCPHLVIRDNKYRGTKGGYARKVPILDELLSLGFADYVEAVRKKGADRLFPDWQPSRSADGESNDGNRWSNSSMLRAFNRTVVPQMLGDKLVAGARSPVTFHSFRGAFKAMLQRKEYGLHPNTINEVIGHAKDELEARYIGEIAIEQTYSEIRGCRFPGLVLPSPPPTP